MHRYCTKGGCLSAYMPGWVDVYLISRVFLESGRSDRVLTECQWELPFGKDVLLLVSDDDPKVWHGESRKVKGGSLHKMCHSP